MNIDLSTVLRSYFCVQKQQLPLWQWKKTSNSTHGFIRAVINIENGPKPIDAVGYRARTLNANRYPLTILHRLIDLCSLIRRDFRLAIANLKDPNQPMGNPVFWFTIPLITEV